MPPRRGILRRIADRFRRPPNPPAPPPPPEPPRNPPGPTGDRFRQIWDREVSQHPDREFQSGVNPKDRYEEFREVFDSIGVQYEDEAEELRFWRDYLRQMIPWEHHTKARNMRRRQDFFNRLGISQRDFDWAAWRIAMGYRRAR